MKKKILSLLMCICVAFGCLFSFAGCSLVKDDNLADGEKIVLSVGDSTFTKDDVVSSFYSFLYNNYALIYNGTDSAVIEEKFYNAFIKDQIVMEKAKEALEEEVIKYCEKDAKNVWEKVEDYFRTQIDSYEKDLYAEESDYPIWLQTQNNEEDEFYNPYEDPSIKNDIDKGEKQEKLTREDIARKDDGGNSKLSEIYKAMFNYVSEKEFDENDEEIRTYTEIKDQEGADKRRQAFALYMENLFLNSKATGEFVSQDEIILDLVEEVYNSYYDSKIAELYQRYCEEVLVLESDELKEESIVKTFIQSLKADKQAYLNEADYVSVITGKDTELILYHNNDKFFTVQHILLKFDDKLVDLIKQDPFYVDMASNDIQLEIFEQFKQNRENIVADYYGANGALTDINEEQLEKMPVIKNVIDNYSGYYKYSEANGYESVASTTEGAKRMATVQDIVDCYNFYFGYIMDCVDAVVDFDADINEQDEEIRYIIESAQKIYDSYGSNKQYAQIRPEIEKKVSSLAFIELSWIFSDDGLYNTIYKQLGYVMANYPDENNNFSHEFVDLSKIIYDSIKNGTTDMTEVDSTQNVVLTKDGVHIIKLDNVFNQGTSLIDISGIKESDYETKAEYYSAVAKLMNETYICNGSTQTVYDYYRDMIYSNLAGDDSTTGSYFANHQNELLKEFLNNGKVSYINKLSYEEIMKELY